MCSAHVTFGTWQYGVGVHSIPSYHVFIIKKNDRASAYLPYIVPKYLLYFNMLDLECETGTAHE